MCHYDVYRFMKSPLGLIEWGDFGFAFGLTPVHCSAINYDMLTTSMRGTLNPKSPGGIILLNNAQHKIHIHMNSDTDEIYMCNTAFSCNRTRQMGEIVPLTIEDICLACHDPLTWDTLLPITDVYVFIKLGQYMVPALCDNRDPKHEITTIIRSIRNIPQQTMHFKNEYAVCVDPGKKQSLYRITTKTNGVCSRYTIPISVRSVSDNILINNTTSHSIYYKFDETGEDFYKDNIQLNLHFLDALTQIYVFLDDDPINYINIISIKIKKM